MDATTIKIPLHSSTPLIQFSIFVIDVQSITSMSNLKRQILEHTGTKIDHVVPEKRPMQGQKKPGHYSCTLFCSSVVLYGEMISCLLCLFFFFWFRPGWIENVKAGAMTSQRICNPVGYTFRAYTDPSRWFKSGKKPWRSFSGTLKVETRQCI